MKIHHIGIAVESLSAALPAFEKILGCAPISRETIADQKVRLAVFELGEIRIEVLEATSPDSPIAKFLAKRGPGIHHLTFAVARLPEKLAELERNGIRLIDRKPRRGAGGEQIAFLHPAGASGVLIELVEERSADVAGGTATGQK
ncbi:MAG: methylmalonyl-CoA epimerase [Terriglobia bacterium]|jgi:methylmalonyl-CoA/ethylmalonyl-CoA epimerase